MSDLWRLHSAWWRGVSQVGRTGVKAVKGSTRAAAAMQRRSSFAALARHGSSGILGPGDGPPPPNADVYDYRGVARESPFGDEGLPLGHAIDVRTSRRVPAALPPHLIFRHAAIFGPSGSGKTTSIIVPWMISLLEKGASVFAVDVKGNLLQEIQRALAGRQALGAGVWCWDYAQGSGHRWNFMKGLSSERAVEAAAVSLLGRAKDNDPQPYFYQRDYRWLKGLLRLSVLLHGRTKVRPSHLVDLLNDPDELAHLVLSGLDPQVVTDLGDLASLPTDEYSRAISGLLNVLSIFKQPSVRRATDASDINLEDIWTMPTLVICVARLSDARLGEQLSSLMVSQLSTLVLDGFGRQRPRPLILMLDEAPRLKDRIDLEGLLAMVRGADTGVCFAAQDVAQFGAPERYESLLSNCQTLISMYGASHATASFFSKRLGQRLAEEISISDPTQAGLFQTSNATKRSTSVPVLGQRELMYPPFGPYSSIVHAPAVCAQPVVCDLDRG